VTALPLARLLQLSSQALPIGGYSHSQGLESAIEHRIVTDEASLSAWMSDILEYSMTTCEVPWLLSMRAAWMAKEHAGVASLNGEFLATRESAELRAAGIQMGYSLCSLLHALPDIPAATLDTLRSIDEPSLPCAWSAAAAAWDIPAGETIMGYLWSWAENQVIVSMKAVPLGQSAAQRVLLLIGSKVALLAESGACRPEDSRSNFAPALAILSSQHETQYSRLFRS
jgi:urease accessory protein